MNGVQQGSESLWDWLGQVLLVHLDIGGWFAAIVHFLQENAQPFFNAVALIIGVIVGNLVAFFNWLPPAAVFAGFALIALWRIGWKAALFVFIGLYLMMSMNLWQLSMDTFGTVLGATISALGVGLPLGVAMAKSNWVQIALRPILDFMQTLPPFVYLIPAVIFFGTGRVPGTIATVIFAMPPCVRLMNLGIRHVPTENVEAGRAFGCNPLQLLFRVELPLAMPSIMAGVNQTIMLALSMVVIAAMIGAGGLGVPVLKGIQLLQVGIGFKGGFAVVLIAIILDRLSQSFAERNSRRDSPLSRFLQLFSRRREST